MKMLLAVFMTLVFGIAVIACGGKVDTTNLKPIETRTVGNTTVVLMNSAGELKQGQNNFVVQFRNQQGQPVDVGTVQIGSSMSMPGMAPMSGNSEPEPTGQGGTYRIRSNFAMSGSWRFTISWNGAHGQGSTAFYTNVR